MRRTTAVVDINSVWDGVHDIGTRFEAAEQIRRCGRSRAVGTVHTDAKPGQVIFDRSAQMINIVFMGFPHTADHSSNFASGFFHNRSIAQQQCFHACFRFVRQFIAAAVEHFDAIVLIWVVGCGNHNACVCLALYREVCYRRRWNNTQRNHVSSYRTNPSNQRRLQHIRGNAGIFPNSNLRRALFIFSQHCSDGLPHTVRHIGG